MSELKPTPAGPRDLIQSIRARTPARLLVGRAGTAYRTATHLELRRDHAAARDAVQAELNVLRDLGHSLVESCGIIVVQTEATSKAEHLLRPDRGPRRTAKANE